MARSQRPKVHPVNPGMFIASDDLPLRLHVEVDSLKCQSTDDSYLLNHAFLKICDRGYSAEIEEKSEIPLTLEDGCVYRDFVCSFRNVTGDSIEHLAESPDDSVLDLFVYSPQEGETNWCFQGSRLTNGNITWMK